MISDGSLNDMMLALNPSYYGNANILILDLFSFNRVHVTVIINNSLPRKESGQTSFCIIFLTFHLVIQGNQIDKEITNLIMDKYFY